MPHSTAFILQFWLSNLCWWRHQPQRENSSSTLLYFNACSMLTLTSKKWIASINFCVTPFCHTTRQSTIGSTSHCHYQSYFVTRVVSRIPYYQPKLNWLEQLIEAARIVTLHPVWRQAPTPTSPRDGTILYSYCVKTALFKHQMNLVLLGSSWMAATHPEIPIVLISLASLLANAHTDSLPRPFIFRTEHSQRPQSLLVQTAMLLAVLSSKGCPLLMKESSVST